jgi:L-amino acid N-acyltransferase YncA
MTGTRSGAASVGPWAIRAARPADATSIAALHVASWRWAYRGLLADEVLAALSVDDRVAMWNELLVDDGVAILVAERDGTLAGFASGSASRDEGAETGTGEVAAIYLAETEAGSGLGGELFERIQVELRARGFTRATLWVLETNVRARRFYEREGWRWDGARSDHQIQCDRQPIVRYAAAL